MINFIVFAALIALAVWPSAETREKMAVLDRIWKATEDTESKTGSERKNKKQRA